MLHPLAQALTDDVWWSYLVRIALFFLLAWIVHRLAGHIVDRVIGLGRFTPRTYRQRPERQATLRSILVSVITFVAFATAVLASVGQFVQTDTLVWMVGLFSAAFGFGLRPLISDFLTGVGLIFEDTYAIGEKVEIQDIEGVIEAVKLRTTWIRAPTGELYVVPNGEVRVVRNFSRGEFSSIKVKLTVPSDELARILDILEDLAPHAAQRLPALLEPWQIFSESGEMGQHTVITLLVKARFGAAAQTRTRVLTLIQERLTEAGVSLSSPS